MKKFTNIFVQLWKDEDGAPATEYALLIALIAVVAAVGMLALGNGLNSIFGNLGTAIGAVTVTPLPGPTP